VISKLRLLDLLLVAVIALLGWQVRREWLAARAREQALRDSAIKRAAVPGLIPLPSVEALTAASYADVAAKNLFSRDRNPDVIIDPPAPPVEKPVPPFPVARGVMLWPGVPPTIVLSEKAGGAQKGYHPGEKIGPWQIVSVDNSYVVLDWEGREFKKRLDELLDRTPIVVAEAPPPAAAPANAPPPSQNLGANAQSGPGADTGGGFKACVPGDTSPSGTVVNGMKKMVTQTPFGNTCHWEQAR
jgi:hypothetical protein